MPPRTPLRLNFTAQQHHFYPNIEQTPDGKPPGVRRLAAQARSIRTEAGLAPSGSPAAQFLSAAASFLPKHRTNPRWFYPSGVRRLAAQARCIRTEAGLAPSGSPTAQFHSAAASFLPKHRTNPQMVLPIWGSSACCASACHSTRGGPCPLGLPRCSVTQRTSTILTNIEQTPDGKPPGVRRLAAQARSIETEAGIAPSDSPAAQFHSTAASFLPKHRTNPRRQAAWGSFNREENMRREKLAN